MAYTSAFLHGHVSWSLCFPFLTFQELLAVRQVQRCWRNATCPAIVRRLMETQHSAAVVASVPAASAEQWLQKHAQEKAAMRDGAFPQHNLRSLQFRDMGCGVTVATRGCFAAGANVGECCLVQLHTFS